MKLQEIKDAAKDRGEDEVPEHFIVLAMGHLRKSPDPINPLPVNHQVYNRAKKLYQEHLADNP